MPPKLPQLLPREMIAGNLGTNRDSSTSSVEISNRYAVIGWLHFHLSGDKLLITQSKVIDANWRIRIRVNSWCSCIR